MEFLGVVRYDRNTLGNSSIQLSFALTNLLLSPCSIVPFVNSAKPLVWRYAMDANRCSIPSSVQKSLKLLASNYSMLSIIRTLGIPCWQLISSQKKSYTYFEIMLLNALTSTSREIIYGYNQILLSSLGFREWPE